jgi:hypothetical protein
MKRILFSVLILLVSVQSNFGMFQKSPLRNHRAFQTSNSSIFNPNTGIARKFSTPARSTLAASKPSLWRRGAYYYNRLAWLGGTFLFADLLAESGYYFINSRRKPDAIMEVRPAVMKSIIEGLRETDS